MTISPRNPEVQEHLRLASNFYCDDMPISGKNEYDKACQMSSAVRFGVEQKLWEVMDKPNIADYGHKAMEGKEYVEPWKKSEAIYKYAMQTQSNWTLDLIQKARSAVRTVDRIIHPRPQNPAAALAVETFNVAMGIMGCVYLFRGATRTVSNAILEAPVQTTSRSRLQYAMNHSRTDMDLHCEFNMEAAIEDNSPGKQAERINDRIESGNERPGDREAYDRCMREEYRDHYWDGIG